MRSAKAPAIVYRTVSLENVEQRDGEIVAALSTDAPVRVWDGQLEVLDHTRTAIDFSRATRGLPLLLNHDRAQLVGRAERLTLKGGKLRASLRFGNTDAARAAQADVAAGVLTDVSIGYSVDASHAEPGAKPGESIRRVSRWTPYEASLVAIPADPSAGVGRSLHSHPIPTMKGSTIPLPTEAPPTVDRTSQILSMADAAGLSVADTREIIASGRSLADLSEDLLRRMSQREGRASRIPTLDSPRDFGPRVGLVDILRAQHPEFRGDRGPVREYARELEGQGFRAQNGGLPFGMYGARSTLSTAVATKGPEAVFSQYGETLDVLRPVPRWEKLGVKAIYGVTSNVRYVEVAGGVSTSWVTEAPGAGVAASSPTLSNRTTSPKFLQAMTYVSKNFITQSVDAELAEREIRAAVDAEVERALFWGSGSANQPAGIANHVGVSSVAIGANGGPMTPAKLAEALTVVSAGNGDVGDARFLATPGIAFSMSNTVRWANTASPLWDLSENTALGRPALMSANLPTNLTKGTSTNCHGAILGDFSAAHLFFFGPGVEVILDPYTLADRNLVRIIVYVAVDVLLTRPSFFAVFRDLLP